MKNIKQRRHAELVSASSTLAVSQKDNNDMRGRSRIKYGMTNLFNNGVKAFTLIELLVVVLIIGILAAVAVPQYQKAVDKSSFVCIMTILKTLTDAQQAAALARGGYPAWPTYFTFDELDIDIQVTNPSCTNADICEFKCGQKNYMVVLRNTATWANFYFWAGSVERLKYYANESKPYALQCSSNRCRQMAKAFGGTLQDGEYRW